MAYEQNKSLFLPIRIELPKPVKVKALIDSGAMSSLIHSQVVKKYNIPTRPLTNPITIRNVDGTKNSEGSITHEAVLTLTYSKKPRKFRFLVGNIGKE